MAKGVQWTAAELKIIRRCIWKGLKAKQCEYLFPHRHPKAISDIFCRVRSVFYPETRRQVKEVDDRSPEVIANENFCKAMETAIAAGLEKMPDPDVPAGEFRPKLLRATSYSFCGSAAAMCAEIGDSAYW